MGRPPPGGEVDEQSWSGGWEAVSLAGETVRRLRTGRVVRLFGHGPATGDADRPRRLESLLSALQPDARAVRCCRQVHGRVLASLGEEPSRPLAGAAEVGSCDGLLTDHAGTVLVVWTADCVPVLMEGGGVVAAVHSGWRGVAAGVVTAAVRRFGVEYGVPPNEITAALGPAIGPCHYPVGQEVVAALATTVPGSDGWHRDGRVDLRRLLSRQLIAAGLEPDAVSVVGGCTACDPKLASHRRDGAGASRQWSAVFLAAS